MFKEERDELMFTWNMIGDVVEGRPNLGTTMDVSVYRQQAMQYSDQFVDITNINDYEAAQKIFAHKVDVLVDLKGHTKDSRLGICAYRPAPLQVTFLGYPGTTGADFFDYILT